MPAILCVIILLTLTNAESNVCDVRLRSTDYFGVLQWNCSGLPSNTTFRVQIREQGRDKPWRDVRQCVGISSNSCDLSEEITHFTELVRLGLEGHMQWFRERSCNLQDITDFSAPSLTMRVVKEDRGAGSMHILVKVNFPCIPKALEDHADWCDNQACCYVTQIVYTTTNVMTRSALVNYDYNDNNSMDEFRFVGVLPGQEYCVVANFTRSAISKPVCIKLDPLPTDLWPVVLGAGGSFLIVIPLTALYLWSRKTAQDRLPRVLEGLLEPACVAPSLHNGPIRLPVAAEDDTPSLISLCSCEPSPPPSPTTHLTPPPCSPLHQLSQYHEYYSNPLTEPPVRGSSTGSDSGGMQQDTLPLDTLVPLLGWRPGGIAAPNEEGPQIWEAGVTYFTDTPRIPLSSLILGLGDMDDTGLYLHGEIMEQSGCMLSTWVEDDGLYHSETVGEGAGHITG